MEFNDIDPSIETAVVVKAPTEWEAQLIANELSDQDIKVALEGTQTAAFHADAPGEVRVVVRKQDLEEARKILENVDLEDQEPTD